MTEPNTCIENDHDYTILNIRLMSGHQNPLITCENCNTVWHNYTPAHHGDLIVIPTNQPPDPEHLTEISDLTQRTGVTLLYAHAAATIGPSPPEEPTHNRSGYLPTGTRPAFNNSGCVERIVTHNPDQDTQ